MNLIHSILVGVIALLAVFLEAAWAGPRNWLGAQIDVLPGLMVYASLTGGLTSVYLVAVVGGLGLDSLSANPLGVSVLPLVGIGMVIHWFRHLILRDQVYAQWVLGLGASAAAPAVTLLFLVTVGYHPLVGLGSIWQWMVMSIGGACLTPLYFKIFARLNRSLNYRTAPESSFRSDRQIERGRN